MMRRFLPGTLLLALLVSGACVPETPGGLYPVSAEVPPLGMSYEAWTHALAAHDRARLGGYSRSPLLAVIDYSRPSTEPRIWVVDRDQGIVLYHDYVAHAARSGGIRATSFSNRDGSNQSSLGTFVTANSYVGVRGISLRLRGLEPGINDRALARGIVIHGTPTVNALRAAQGRLGRTNGCPAVPMESVRRLIGLIENGVVLFSWYPDRTFLAHSQYVDRGAALLRLTSGD